MTSEQLEASRAERMRQNGHGPLTLDEARTWIEETGFCLFLPKRQFSAAIAPSFVEATAGERNATPDPRQIAIAEELLIRLENDGVAVRLNLLGQAGEQPDFVVAGWVLPYVYALRGDRDWRRSPQLTGSRQVSPLAIQAYKRLEAGDSTIAELTFALGREVTESAVLRAITELWQQLRIIPVISAPGQPAEWQLLRQRFQKAIAEGASTSQVTAISVLASIYLQAVIAASMEEVELFLAPLTARSKVREVLRGLVATRQVHTLSLGHSPHFYVAGTLPEFAAAPSAYTSASMPASAYFSHSFDDLEEDLPAVAQPQRPSTVAPAASAPVVPAPVAPRPTVESAAPSAEPHAPRPASLRKPAAQAKPAAARPHFSRPATHSRDRKPAQSLSSSRPARRSSSDARPSTGSRTANGGRPASGARWNPNAPKSADGARTPSRSTASASNGTRSNGNGHANRSANGSADSRGTKSAARPWSQRAGHPTGSKSTGQSSSAGRNNGPRTESRADARPARSNRTPALTAGAKAGNSKRFGFTARPSQGTKKRG